MIEQNAVCKIPGCPNLLLSLEKKPPTKKFFESRETHVKKQAVIITAAVKTESHLIDCMLRS
jgi:hypothetical protein